MYPLNEYPEKIRQELIIETGQWLNDDHIDEFGKLLRTCSGFSPRSQFFIFHPELITPVSPNEKHIQVLFSCNDLRPKDANGRHLQIEGGHWVCSYYDGNRLYVYDSLNGKRLHTHHLLFLRALYPYYDFDQRDAVSFPLVDQQPNSNDCGVYSIAFATAILSGLKPENMRYHQPTMRLHLLKMFLSAEIEQFPCNPIEPTVMVSLAQVRKNWRASVLAAQREIEARRQARNESSSSEPIIIDYCASIKPLSISKTGEKDFNNHVEDKRVTFADYLPKRIADRKTGRTKLQKKGAKDKATNRSQTQTFEKIPECPISESMEPLEVNSLPKSDRNITLLTSSNPPNSRTKVKSFESDMDKTRNMIGKQVRHGESRHKTLTDQKQVLNFQKYRETTFSLGSESSKVNVISVNNIESLAVNLSSDTDRDIASLVPTSNLSKANNKITSYEDKLEKKRKTAETKSKWRAKKREECNKKQERDRKCKHAEETAKWRAKKREVCSQNDTSEVELEKKRKHAEQVAKWRAKKREKCNPNDTPELQMEKKSKDAEAKSKQRAKKRKQNFIDLSVASSIADDDKTDIGSAVAKRMKLSTSTDEDVGVLNSSDECDRGVSSCVVPKRVKLVPLTRQRTFTQRLLAEAKKNKIRRLKEDKQLKEGMQTPYTKELYVRAVWTSLDAPSSPLAGRLEAERIVTWCFTVRKKYLIRLRKTLANSKKKVEICLTRSAKVPCSNPRDEVQTLCGQSKHTASSEAYYADASYRKLEHDADAFYHKCEQSQPIVMNTQDRAVNMLPLIKTKNKKTKAWACGPLCKTDDRYVLNKLKAFCQQLMNCELRELDNFLRTAHQCSNKVNLEKLGHPYSCYMNPKECLSTFLSLEILAPHFPMMRNLKRCVHDLMNFNKKLRYLDDALDSNNIDTLKGIADEAQKEADSIKTDMLEINLNEREIMSKYQWAFRAFTKRVNDTPRLPCISCEKLCTEKNTIKIDIFKESKYGDSWNTFKDCLKRFDLPYEGDNYICRYCDGKFSQDKMPPTCIANDLYVRPVPPMMQSLNIYETILIQRAKAFQVVQKLGTVSKKNQLHSHKVPKVVGRTFHLPLPMDETLKKICPSSDPINAQHELYILVRGIPTKTKVIWEQLVDLKKVWLILQWLQSNNPLYLGIELPKSHENLLPDNLRDAEYQEEQLDSNNERLEHDDVSSEHDKKKAALLTQMSQSDGYYEKYSIYPIHQKKINRTATDLYQMLKVYDRPLANRAEHLDLKCFPDLYPYGENGQNEPRSVRLTDFEFIKSRLMSKHRQFRLHEQYLFFLLYNNNLRQINAGIFHKLNVTNPRSKYTAANYLDEMSKGLLESNLSTIFSRLRNTEQFWVIPRSNLTCMIRNYGPATWFLTFSPSEWLWMDLVEYLRDVNDIPSEKKISPMQLIVSDPVSTSRFIDIKFQAMLDFICSPDNPIGQVEHYFWRREYQTRGAQHFHLLIWIKDAPIIGKSSEMEIASFILKYVTCRMPDRKVSPELYRRVKDHQCHRHNSYCMRTKKTKTGYTKRCKFGHPRPLTQTLKLRDVSVAIAGRKQLKTRSRLYDLPRGSAEPYVNDYNPAILCAWEGNMDLQFVGEESTLLTWYTTKYVSKAEKSNIADPFELLNSTKSVASCLWNLSMRMLSNRECGAFEAADSLLGIGLHGTDSQTTIKWVDVNMIRSRRLKPRTAIEALQSESTDLFYASVVDTYYPRRPKKLESINLYDFAKWYNVTDRKPTTIDEVYKIGESKYLTRRPRGCLINHCIYNVKTQPELYYYAILLLFQPWREIAELKGTSETYAEAFMSLQSQLADGLRYHEKINDIKLAMEFVTEEVAKHLKSPEKADELCNNEILECVPVEIEGAMKDFKDVGDKVDANNLSEMIAELNADQKRIFDTVTNALQSENEIIRLYISGEGGTGKSFLIKTLRLWTRKVLDKDAAVAAPTGIAAFNVDGLTIHRLFQLPVEHGHTAKYRELSDSVLKLLRDQLRNVALIIIDEVSMISNITLMYIHLRLTEIFNTGESDDGWFGKRHIIVFGDLLQLPPVHEEAPFMSLSKKKIDEFIGAMGPVDLWSNLFCYDELRINMRQKGDHSYRDLLSRIRIGVVLDSDTTVLQSRKLQFNATTIEGRLNEICDYMYQLPLDAVCLLPTCALCDSLNAAMLARIDAEEIELIAQDTVECVSYMKKKVSKILCNDDDGNSRTAGMSKIITVKVGSQIMIRRNIDVTLGLVNGTIATVVSIRRTLDTNGVESIDIALPSGVQHTLERMSVKFEVMDRAFVVRKQFPICLSYGMTIHKSQGLSLNNALVDAGNSIFSCGQIYVALSRVTKLEGLHLINYDPASVKANAYAIVEYNRLRNKYRPDLEGFNVVHTRAIKTIDTIWSISARMLACQQQVQDKPPENILSSVRGLENRDNVSCYAIATIQCIIHCSPIREAILIQSEKNAAIRSFVEAYMSPNKDDYVDILKVRGFLGGTFMEKIQQDAGEFINLVCEQLCSIRNTVNHLIRTVQMCRSCNTETSYPGNPNNVLLLAVPTKGKKSLSLQEIIDDNIIKWKSIKLSCNTCNASPVLQRTKIASTRRVLIIQLLLFDVTDGQVKKKICSVKAVPTTTVRINECRYRVTSAIFHHGTSVQNGHYTSMLRMKRTAWVSADDSRIQKRSWPRNV